MKRLFPLALSLGLVVVSSLSLVGADLPVVRQPNDPAYSAADHTALAAAATAVEGILNAGYPLSRLQMSKLGWSDDDFVQFTAGTLESAGYTVLLAGGSWAGTARTWILVGVPLASGVGYIPVEAARSALTSSYAIGQIAWQGSVPGTSFDSRYLGFTQALAPAPNSPPAVTLSIADRYVVVGETTTLMVTGRDSDGVILAYLWAFSNGTTIAGAQPVLWYTFGKTGDVTVTLTVIDTRGARTTLSVVAEVLAEAPDCGCND